ncbi:tyrosine-type recombinase/integrase [Methanocaldococcus sp.]
MGKRPSLKHQFKFLINLCFKEGMNKRSLKIKYLKGKMSPVEEMAYKSKIFSYGYKNGLMDFVSNFINYLKEKGYYSEYKYVKDLNSEVFAEFMEDLERRGISYKTLKTYRSYIQKLENIAKFRLRNPSIDFTSKLPPLSVPKEFKRVYCLDKSTYFKLINHILESKDYQPTGNNLGILLIASFGLRVKELRSLQFGDIVTYEDIAKRGDTKKIVHKSPYNLYLYVHEGKNGRIRYLPVVFRFQYSLIQYIKNLQRLYNLEDSCYVTSLSHRRLSRRSVRKLVRQKLSEIGVNVDVPTSSHMLRKTWAKMLYEFYKNGGVVDVDYSIDGDLRKIDFSEVENLDFDKIYDYKEEKGLYLDSLKLVSLSLGHNRVDSSLFKTYLSSIPIGIQNMKILKVATKKGH